MDILITEATSVPSLKNKVPPFIRRARLGNLGDRTFSKQEGRLQISLALGAPGVKGKMINMSE